MNREIEIHIDLDGQSHLVGRLWSRLNKGREGASFVYDPSWLASHCAFRLNPRSVWTRDRIILGRVILSLEHLGIPPRTDGGAC